MILTFDNGRALNDWVIVDTGVKYVQIDWDES